MSTLCVLLGARVSSAYTPAWPRFSWDSPPVFYHSCNFTGPFTDAAIATMAKFPMVTIEKGQGVTLGTGPGNYAEDKIVATLKRVKALDANISTIFYYNSVLDWPFYEMHAKLLSNIHLATHDINGELCRQNGDGTFPNHTDMLSFDFAQEAAREFWASECYNMTQTGYVDGCFSDRATGGPSCKQSKEADAAYAAGHIQVHQELQKLIGNGPLIANHAYDMPGVNAVQIEGFKADNASITVLLECVSNGKIVEAHSGYGEDGTADDHCTKGILNSLAAFLIGAGSRSYYTCSRGWKVQEDPINEAWHPEYDKPLGTPKGGAVYDAATSTWSRSFLHAKGTTLVRFDAKTNAGWIAWAGEPVPPVPPTPTPPPPRPLAKCGDPSTFFDAGVANGDITPGGWHPDHLKTDNATACCVGCTGVPQCVYFTWYSDGSRECHYHSKVATVGSPSKGRTSGRVE